MRVQAECGALCGEESNAGAGLASADVGARRVLTSLRDGAGLVEEDMRSGSSWAQTKRFLHNCGRIPVMNPPPTKRDEIVEIIHGKEISDPYQWLENGDDPEVQKWIESQNEYTDSFLKNDFFETFSRELVKNFKVTNFTNPKPVRGSYFYTERQPDEDQMVLYVKHGLDAIPIILVNPNGMKEGNTVSLDYWAASHTGRYIAYGLSEGGDEMSTLHVMEVATQKILESIERCRHSAVRFLPDDSGFFYNRNPKEGEVPKNEEHLHSKVYFHTIRTNPMDDPLIFGEGRPKDDMIDLTISADGNLLAIYVAHNWAENEVYLYDRQAKVLKPLIVGIPSKFYVLFTNERVLLHTNYHANNNRVLACSLKDITQPLEMWHELVPEKEYVLEGLSVTEDKILLQYLVNVCSQVTIIDHGGKEIGTLPLPPFSDVSGISSRKDEKEFFYSVESYIFPKKIYHFAPLTNLYSLYREVENPINPEDYIVKQEWVISKDGTGVPMFIFHKKDIRMNGENPLILQGYGGFGINSSPIFMRTWLPWLERGGVFAVANIRGGSEFGEKWHMDGIREKKQNTFDDFISCAEYVVQKKYTNHKHLGIVGGSNGGLLVSAVTIQRPDLFDAVCARVPLTDMVRFPQFGVASRWTNEYGNPQIKEELEWLLTWSPYHNVKEGTEYPNFLFTTANKDSRVNSLHARKMAALLQATNKTNPVLLFTEMEAGHGAGKPISKMVEVQAMILSFFFAALK